MNSLVEEDTRAVSTIQNRYKQAKNRWEERLKVARGTAERLADDGGGPLVLEHGDNNLLSGVVVAPPTPKTLSSQLGLFATEDVELLYKTASHAGWAMSKEGFWWRLCAINWGVLGFNWGGNSDSYQVLCGRGSRPLWVLG